MKKKSPSPSASRKRKAETLEQPSELSGSRQGGRKSQKRGRNENPPKNPKRSIFEALNKSSEYTLKVPLKSVLKKK